MGRNDLFDDDEGELEPPEPGEDRRCTPERLLEFVRELGRKPTLAECKQKFGGILGPIVDYWELQRRGLI